MTYLHNGLDRINISANKSNENWQAFHLSKFVSIHNLCFPQCSNETYSYFCQNFSRLCMSVMKSSILTTTLVIKLKLHLVIQI